MRLIATIPTITINITSNIIFIIIIIHEAPRTPKANAEAAREANMCIIIIIINDHAIILTVPLITTSINLSIIIIMTINNKPMTLHPKP